MKKRFVPLAALLVAVFSVQAEESDVCAATGSINTRIAMEDPSSKVILTYDPAWLGAESCALKLNGETLATASHEGCVVWNPEPGIYSVTLEGGGKTLVATCIIGTGTDAVAAKGPLDVACVGAFVTGPSAKTVAYDPAWIDAATCSVRVNGEVVVANTAQAGVIDWLPKEDGIYSFELVGGEKSLANTLIVGTGVAESESVGSVDTRTGQWFANLGEVKTVAYSPQWDQAAFSSVKENGRQIVRSAAEGTLDWTAAECGRYKLAHETEKGVLQAEFTVLGEDVMVHEGILFADEVWSADRVHLVTANVTVPAGVTLTIEPGAVVKFRTGTQLIVETGASGVCAGAILTHVADDTVGGDTLMDGSETRPVCAAYGIVGMVEDDDKTQYRYQEPVKLSGTIAADTTWRASGVYRVTGNLTVASGATLTIQPGAIVKFDDGVSMTVSSGATLNAVGTRAMPIVFTSVKDDEYAGDTNGDGDATAPQHGDWKYVYVSGKAKLAYCQLQYGAPSNETGILEVSGGTLEIENCTIAHAKYDGLWNWGGTLTIQNTILFDCGNAVAPYRGTTTCRNCIMAECNYGYMDWSHWVGGTFVNCIFYRCGMNWSDTNSSAEFQTHTTVKNCIFYNTANYTKQSCTKDGVDGCRYADPQFIDPDNGDFRVAETSPCLDAGDTASAPSRDYYGQPRVGAAADVGIYEIMPRYVASDTDLRVLSVSAAEAAVVGDTLKVEWQVSNNGTAPVYETWRDKVELVSARGEKILLGERLMKSGLAAGGSRTCAGEWQVPVVAEGTYTVQVTVNYARDIFEGALTENNVATANLRVSVPSAAATDGATLTVRSADESVLHFTIDPASVDRLITITATDGMYAIFGTTGVPTESYNVGKVNASEGVICFIVPENVSDVYVRLVNGSAADAECEVAFSTARVKILDVSPRTIPYDGKVTVRVEGAGLNRVKRVAFKAADATLVPCTSWRADSSGQIVVSADGTLLNQGAEYRLALVDENDEETDSEQRVSVTKEPARPEVWAKMKVPDTVRDGRQYLCNIEYGNKGNADAIAPILQVSVCGSGQLKLLTDETLQKNLLFVGAGASDNAGVLVPGETKKIEFTYIAGSASDSLTLSVGEDRELAVAAERIALRGVDATDYFAAMELAESIKAGEPCGVYYGYVRDSDGYPVSDYYVTITNAGVNVGAVTDANGHFVTEGWGDEDVRVDQEIVAVSSTSCVIVDGSDKFTSVIAVSRVTGASYDGERLANCSYVFRGIADGGYVVRAQGENGVAALNIYVTNGEYGEVKLVLGETASITGTFTGDGSEETPTVYLVGGGTERLAKVNAIGRFEFDGLPAGDYVLMYAGTNYADYVHYVDIELTAGQEAICDIQKTNNLQTVSASPMVRTARCSVALQTTSDIVTEDNVEHYVMLVSQYYPTPPPSDRDCKHNKERYRKDVRAYNTVVNMLNSASIKKSEKDLVQMQFDKNQRDLAWMLVGSGLSALGKAKKFAEAISKFEELAKLVSAAGGLSVSIRGIVDTIRENNPTDKALSIGQILCSVDDLAINAEYVLAQLNILSKVKEALYEVWAAHKIWLLTDCSDMLDDIDKAFNAMNDFLGLVIAARKGLDNYKLLQQRDALNAELQAALYLLNGPSGIHSILCFREYPLCCQEFPAPVTTPPVQTNDVKKVMSVDPNEVVGPVGLGDPNTERFMRPGEWMTYTVYFENASNATAGAQEVFVTNPLSEWLDWTTFEMGEVAFAGQIDTGLSGLQIGESEIDFTGTVYRVRSSVTINKQTGQVDWYLRIVDPATATGWPEDPYAGFLQPNDETHCGEGHLTYRVKIREDAPRNVRIENAASIVFDYNEAIPTDPSWWNTVGWPLTVGEAASDEKLEWTTGGAGEWTAVSAETSPDGKDQAVLRSVGNNASGWLSTTVTGAGNLSFVWRGGWSARTTRVQFFVDGEAAALLSGTNGWETVDVAVYGAGEHELTWRFATGRSGATEDDFLALDEVTWTASEPLDPPTLAEALNPLLKWKTDGDVPWQGVRRNSQAESRESWAAIDGLGDDEYAGLETRVYGTGALRFDWAVSSEEGYDELIVSVDGQMRQRISGDVAWHSKELKIVGLGWHTVRWEYVKEL